MTDAETDEIKQMVAEIDGATGESQYAIAASWAAKFFDRGAADRRTDYHRERDQERLMFMSSVIASGIATPKGAVSEVADRAVQIAKAVMSRVEQ